MVLPTEWTTVTEQPVLRVRTTRGARGPPDSVVLPTRTTTVLHVADAGLLVAGAVATRSPPGRRRGRRALVQVQLDGH